MGNVWRADRPQRGRYRQFMQCDIDILGEPTNLAEIELILSNDYHTWQTWIQEFRDPYQRAPYLKGNGSLQRICRGRVRYRIYHSGQDGQDWSGRRCRGTCKRRLRTGSNRQISCLCSPVWSRQRMASAIWQIL